MGWTSYHAAYYKSNGEVDRKKECDAYFMEGLNRGHFKVLKSSMVGNTYYAAIKEIVEYEGEDENKNPIYTPIENGEVWAAIFLTSTNNKDYYNFSYKDMDETCGPYQCDCPESILKLLSETKSEYALAWRQRCRDKRKQKNALMRLPIGTVIEFVRPGTESKVVAYKHAPEYQFKQPFWMIEGTMNYVPFKHIPKDFVVVR